MSVYVSRFSNPELRKGIYTTVRISLGTPKWPLDYHVDGEIKDLMPFGMLNKYSHEEFVIKYKERLNKIGVQRIRSSISRYARMGKPVVLLCYEDVRVEGQHCHRTTFAEWWHEKTGETIEELTDPSIPKGAIKKRVLEEKEEQEQKPTQISLFAFLT